MEKVNAYLQETIPLLRVVGLRVNGVSESVLTSSAPLEPNINMHGTAFAGSLYVVCVASGVAAVAVAAATATSGAVSPSIVCTHAAIRYKQPVATNTITIKTSLAFGESPPRIEGLSRLRLPTTQAQFVETLVQTRKAYVAVRAVIDGANGKPAVEFDAVYLCSADSHDPHPFPKL